MPVHRFVQMPSGFRVERLCRWEVTVRLEPWTLWVTSAGYPARRCGLYNGDQLTHLIAGRLLGEEEAEAAAEADGADALASKLRTGREARAIATEVGLQRFRLLAGVDPAVHGVQFCLARTAGRIPRLAEEAALYRERYVVRDVLSYRAAAIALACLQQELWPHFARVRGHDGGVALPDGAAEPSSEQLIAAMTEWRGLFSPDGRPYRSLNRTLMNLPPEVPFDLVCRLNQVRLERPLLHGLELTTLLLAAGAPLAGDPEVRSTRLRIFQHATAADIAAALARIGANTRRQLRPARLQDLGFAIRFLCDHPQPYRGTLAGLVERAIRWHCDAHERRVLQDLLGRLGGPRRATARPPIPLPAVPGITLLGTVGRVVEEGARMRHCIASRAKDAVAGRCFLFHVEYQGEQASVEVSAGGEVVDAEGPGNSDNVAARWGAMQLRAWGLRLGARRAPPPRDPGRQPRRRAAADPNQLTLPF